MLDYNCIKPLIPESVFSELLDITTKYNINTPLRLAHFLSQCAHESMNFKVLEENLMYSASGLLSTFKKYFTKEEASMYAKKPMLIASKVYGNRLGNGDESTGDGYTYRGRGYIQLTGKDNYIAFDKKVAKNIVDNPGLVATEYPLESAAWFFSEYKKLNEVADLGASKSIVLAVTRRINGGTNGLDDRLQKFNQFYPLLLKE